MAEETINKDAAEDGTKAADKLEERIVVVDPNDNVIGAEKRGVVDKENLTYRVSALWIKNSKGETLLARRSYEKSHSPGMWGPAVAGTVKENESYRHTIINEAKEELGLEIDEPTEGPKVERNKEGKHHYFTKWYIYRTDKPAKDFVLQKEEVAEVKWFSNEELRRSVEDNPKEFLEGTIEMLNMLG